MQKVRLKQSELGKFDCGSLIPSSRVQLLHIALELVAGFFQTSALRSGECEQGAEVICCRLSVRPTGLLGFSSGITLDDGNLVKDGSHRGVFQPYRESRVENRFRVLSSAQGQVRLSQSRTRERLLRVKLRGMTKQLGSLLVLIEVGGQTPRQAIERNPVPRVLFHPNAVSLHLFVDVTQGIGLIKGCEKKFFALADPIPQNVRLLKIRTGSLRLSNIHIRTTEIGVCQSKIGIKFDGVQEKRNGG